MFSNHIALNNVDWTTNGVNPLTKMFIYNVPLVEVYSNNIQGPNITLGIRKNPSSDEDRSFGTGWELTLTRITKLNLCLSDGRRFILNKDGALAPGQNCKDFYLVKNKDSMQEVIYTDGVKETLDKNGNLIKIDSPNGRFILLRWSNNRLSEILDMQSKSVLTIKYLQASNAVKFLHASGNLTLSLTGGVDKAEVESHSELKNISIAPSSDVESPGVSLYDFEYNTSMPNYPLTGVKAYGAKKERLIIDYEQMPAKDPEGALIPLVNALHRNIDKTRSVTTEWQADKGSFLNPVQIHEEKLKSVVTGHEVTEATSGVKISRIYNSLYQLVCETTVDDKLSSDSIEDCQYTIFEEKSSGKTSEKSIAQFRKIPTKTIEGQEESFVFNQYGKIDTHIDLEMISTKFSYKNPVDLFGASEEHSFPVNYLCLTSEVKSNLAKINVNSIKNNRFKKMKTYTYQVLKSNSKYAPVIVIAALEENQILPDGTEDLIKKITYDYHVDDAWYGCMKSSTELRSGKGVARVVNYDYSFKNESVMVLTENTVVDGIVIDYKSKKMDINTGLIVEELFNNEIIAYEYDAFKRLKQKSVGDKYSFANYNFITTYTYSDDSVSVQDYSGLITVKRYDYNADLLSRKYILNGQHYLVEENEYDDFGNVKDQKTAILKLEPLQSGTEDSGTVHSGTVHSGTEESGIEHSDTDSEKELTTMQDVEINTRTKYNIYGDVERKIVLKYSKGEMNVCRDEMYLSENPFRLQRVNVNKKLQLTMIRDAPNRINSVRTNSLIDKSTFSGISEDTFYDAFNRAAMVKTTDFTINTTYDKYDRKTSDEITGPGKDSRISKTEYIYFGEDVSFTDRPQATIVNSIPDKITQFDKQGRPIIIYSKGQALVYEYTDTKNPMLPTVSTQVVSPPRESFDSAISVLKKAKTEGLMSLSLSYDSFGRLKSKSGQKIGSKGAPDFEFTYLYDNKGNVKEASKYESGVIKPYADVVYEYDPFGNVIKEKNQSGTINYGWMTDGSLSSLDFMVSNMKYLEEYAYEGGLLTSTTISLNGKTLAEVTYRRDLLNLEQLREVTYTFSFPGLPQRILKKTDFKYDESESLTGYKLKVGASKPEDDLQVYSVDWTLDSNDQITKVHSTNYLQETFEEKFYYTFDGKVSKWEGKGQAMLGRDSYDNKIIEATISFTKPGDIDSIIYTHSSRGKYSIKNDYLYDGRLAKSSYIQPSDNQNFKGSPQGAPDSIQYYYEDAKILNKGTVTSGGLSTVSLTNGKDTVLTTYASNGYATNGILNTRLTNKDINQSVHDSLVGREISYDAFERTIFTTDLSGHAMINGELFEKRKVKTVNQYSLDKVKSVTFMTETTEGGEFEMAARNFYHYDKDMTDFILMFDKDGQPSGFELLAGITGGATVAAVKASRNDNNDSVTFNEYSRSPTGDIFVVHNAILNETK